MFRTEQTFQPRPFVISYSSNAGASIKKPAAFVNPSFLRVQNPRRRSDDTTQAFITMNVTLTRLAINARSFTSERRAQNISVKKDWACEELISDCAHGGMPRVNKFALVGSLNAEGVKEGYDYSRRFIFNLRLRGRDLL
ncbi:MAG: hypothetical protein DMF73_17360 [Acidobacteria bacterium]|nr:MAG: hypothetical protein DMF73_17360 [Acidobacteriota bacterium]